MRVKLRPGTHLAPVRQGIYLSRNGDSFILQGPAALYALVDSQLGRLVAGATVDELVAAVGSEAARPVLDHVLRTLLARDVLLDVDAGAPPPEPGEAHRYADVLAYLEGQCADPYAVFARLRAATVLLVGDAATLESLPRSLAACAIGSAATDAPPALAIAVVTPGSTPQWPAEVPLLPVFLAPAGALVGPVCAGPAEFAAVTAAAERMASWQRHDPLLAAPAPMSAVLAGSLAARAAFEQLAGVGGADRSATVVYGRRLESRQLQLPGLGESTVESSWTTLDPAAILADGEPALPTAAQAHELTGALTARFTGLAGWHRDLDLPQLPLSMVTLESRLEQPPGRLLGWAESRAAAGVNAMLAFLRARSAAIAPAIAGNPQLVPAAGLTPGRFLVDGLLRIAGARALAETTPDKIAWAELNHRPAAALWSLLRDYFDVPAELWLRAVPGLGWSLASVVCDGVVLATQWGPAPATAAQAALSAAVARAQLGPELAELLPAEPVGTWALESLAAEPVASCQRQLTGWLAAQGRPAHASRLASDPVAGEIALPCGAVWLS